MRFLTRFWSQMLIIWLFGPSIGGAQEKGKQESIDQRAIQEQVKKYPDVEDAILLFQRGNTSGALALLKSAYKKNPQISPPEVMLARLYFAAKNSNACKQALQTSVLLYPNDPEPWNLLANLHLQSGNWAESELLFEKAILLAGKAKESTRMKNQLSFAYNGVVKSNEVRRVWNRAEFFLLQWRKRNSKSVEILRRLAGAQLQLKKIDEATETLKHAKELDPKQLPPGVSIGLYYQNRGEVEKAYQAMQQALADDSESISTQSAVARWALTANKLSMARRCIAQCQKLSTNSHLANLLDATADLYDNQAESAEKKFRELVKDKPADFEVVTGLAFSLLKQTDTSKLQQALEYAKLLVKSNSDVRKSRGRQSLALLAWALFKNGDTDQASKVIQKVIAPGEIGQDMAFFAAAILSELNKKDPAKALVSKALENPGSFIHRAEAMRLKSKLDK